LFIIAQNRKSRNTSSQFTITSKKPDANFSEKVKSRMLSHSGFLSMSYEKDIFAVFAFEFELLHNRSFLVKSFTYAHGEIIYSVNCEI